VYCRQGTLAFTHELYTALKYQSLDTVNTNVQYKELRKKSPSEANSCSGSQEISHRSWIPKLCYILKQLNNIYTSPSCFNKTGFNIVIRLFVPKLCECFLSFRFFTKNFCAVPFCLMTTRSTEHFIFFDLFVLITGGEEQRATKFLICFSIALCPLSKM